MVSELLRTQVLHGNEPGPPPEVIESDDPELYARGHQPPFEWNPDNVARLCEGFTEYQTLCVADALCIWWNVCSMYGANHTARTMLDCFTRTGNAAYIIAAVALLSDLTVKRILLGD